jgi:hypothetical protein
MPPAAPERDWSPPRSNTRRSCCPGDTPQRPRATLDSSVRSRSMPSGGSTSVRGRRPWTPRHGRGRAAERQRRGRHRQPLAAAHEECRRRGTLLVDATAGLGRGRLARVLRRPGRGCPLVRRSPGIGLLVLRRGHRALPGPPLEVEGPGRYRTGAPLGAGVPPKPGRRRLPRATPTPARLAPSSTRSAPRQQRSLTPRWSEIRSTDSPMS